MLREGHKPVNRTRDHWKPAKKSDNLVAKRRIRNDDSASHYHTRWFKKKNRQTNTEVNNHLTTQAPKTRLHPHWLSQIKLKSWTTVKTAKQREGIKCTCETAFSFTLMPFFVVERESEQKLSYHCQGVTIWVCCARGRKRSKKRHRKKWIPCRYPQAV